MLGLRPYALVLSVLLGGLWGCPDDGVTRAPQCVETHECSNGRTCQFGYCVAGLDNSTPFHIELRPPNNSILVAQQLAHVTTPGSSLEVTLLPSVIISGDVLKEAGGRASGTLTARTDGEIPGLAHLFTGKSNGAYSIALLPDRHYKVTFRPDNDELPPHSFEWDRSVTADTGEHTRDILLPTGRLLKGTVTWQKGIGPEGATVTAYSMDGVRLTKTQTEDFRGYYQLLLPPGEARVQLRVKAAADGPHFPTYSTEVDWSDEDVGIQVKKPQPLTPTDIGVVGKNGEDVKTLSDVNLTFVMADTEGRHTVSTTTGEAGTASLELLPGTYTVTVAPNEVTWFATAVSEVVITSAPGALTFTLDPRPVLSGAVRDDAKNRVSGEVTAKRRSGDGFPLGPASFKAELVDGAFTLVVDPGSYDIKYTPLHDTQAPPFWFEAELTGDRELEPTDLPAPGVLAVRVLDPDGDWLEDVQVRVFQASSSSGLREYSTEFTDHKGWVANPVPFGR